jgi:DNA-binding transcriptional ArsR family regulator
MNTLDKATVGWDFGTAYEFFISLHVLHEPDQYGIRASWAAGIRSRIPAVERKLLEEVMPFMGWPIGWVYKLPAPKDAISAMWSMRQIPAAERFIKIYEQCCDGEKDEYYKTLVDIATRRSWGEKDLNVFLELVKKKGEKDFNVENFKRYLDWWTRPAEFGDAYLAALQAYHAAFFEDEEKRITPVLKAGLERAQAMAQNMSVSDLIQELSQGVRFEEDVSPKEVIIAPLYWTTPLILFDHLDSDRMIFLFGARPADMSAIPGELVPDGLLRTLKALADPTRLKILNYLSKEELTPSELARRLNLRAPTVTHHLSDLRLSGLVNLTIRGQEKVYRTRREALAGTFATLEHFL